MDNSLEAFQETADSQSFHSMRKISCEKLSWLQKLILVMLCEAKLAVKRRREFNREAKRLYWGNEGRVATSDLSQAMRRLEDRQAIRRQDGRWILTDSPPGNGLELALLAWASAREFWARLGLKGPPLEALGLGTKKPAKPGVRVQLDCSMP